MNLYKKRKRKNRGEMGVGTLIIFIAMILISAIAAGVLLQTGSYLQEKSLSSGRQSRSEVSTNVKAIEVSATDGRDGTINYFSTIFKLSPGSDAIRMDDVALTESTLDTTSYLKQRNDSLPINDVFEGYFTATSNDYGELTFEEIVPSTFFSTFSSWTQTSQFMIGRIAVNIIFIETNGSVDTNCNNWTAARQEEMLVYAEEAMEWWNDVEPRAHIRYDFKLFRDIKTSYDPALRDRTLANLTLWMNQTLTNVGAPDAADIYLRTVGLNQQTREELNTHWAFTLFLVDSEFNGTDEWGSAAGYAVINGPFAVISTSGTYSFSNPGLLYAHEFGHCFGAYDEYLTSGCACTSTSGYYSIETQNCEAGCLTNISTIYGNLATQNYAYLNHLVSIHSLAQMGLIDADGNNMLDPIDDLFDGKDQALTTTIANDLALNGYDNPSLISTLGFFSIEYMQRATNYQEGMIQRGDVVKVRHEAGKDIINDEIIRFKLIPKIGGTTLTNFITPEVISTERVYLYP